MRRVRHIGDLTYKARHGLVTLQSAEDGMQADLQECSGS